MAKQKTLTGLKNTKYSRKGLVLFVVVFAALGAYFLLQTNAAPSVAYSNFLNYTDAASTPNVTNATDFIGQVGTQTVSQVAPSGQLDYLIGGKVAFGSICYYVRAVNPKGVGTVAQVDFAGQYNSKTISVPVSNNYQPVCISSGHSTTMKGYSVYNMSALDGPAILVYQAVINF
jgi:hypothetical protein